jgi:pimeloyl-ACP methyl ester carboxylesterase
METPAGDKAAGITRRNVLGYSAAALPVVASAMPFRGATRAAPRGGVRPDFAVSPARLSLPPPTGPHPVATRSTYLVDASRTDPWTPSRPRELMIQFWYPARSAGGPRAAYMPPGAARHYAVTLSGLLFETVAADSVLALRTRALAPEDPAVLPRGLPVIISPGEGLDRSSATGIVTDLASYGFTVVGIDHTHDSAEVEFPGGRVETGMLQPSDPASVALALDVRVADMRFVTDLLAQLNPGRIGMFGHSLGGAAAAQAMLGDPRISAGANLDGTILGSVASAGLDQPFLLFGSALHESHHASDPSWHQFWQNLRGWRREIVLNDGGHLSFTDIELFGGPGGPLDASASFPSPKAYLGTFGSVNPARAMLINRLYLRAFFDHFLRDSDSSLLDGPSPAFPEILFERP